VAENRRCCIRHRRLVLVAQIEIDFVFIS
jgi:hypothetical protein